MIVVLALLACKEVEPAPEDLDGLFHWFWERYDEGEDEELADGIINLHEAVDGGSLEGHFDGSISRLGDDETALVGVADRDADDAVGLFLVNVYDCDLEQLEDILIYLHQGDLYTDAYDSYERGYTSDRDAFEDRSASHLSWEVDYSSSYLGTSFDAHIEGGVRYLPELDDELSPYGPALFGRTWMPEPAQFESDGKSLDQDYQLEIYYERAGGEILHAYGLWREADFGSVGDMETEGIQRLLLNNLKDWDDQTEVLCEEGRP